MNNIGEEAFEEIKRLGQESSISITGTVKADARAPGIPGGYEIGIRNVVVLQNAVDYPIGPKEHGVDFLMDQRHPVQGAGLPAHGPFRLSSDEQGMVGGLRGWMVQVLGQSLP